MTIVASQPYRQYRAPAGNNAALVQPSSRELARFPNSRENSFSDSGLEFCGKPIDSVRAQARDEVVELATKFTGRYKPVSHTALGSRPIVLSGHQPELFHPGVWFKNFLLSSLAKETGAVAINFLVDNDLCRTPAIGVPTRNRDGENVSVEEVPFDSERDAIPWELRTLGSREIWNSFPSRVGETLPRELDSPILNELWKDATESVSISDRPGLAIAEARHKLEHRLGLDTLEVPLSHLVSTRAFARFSIQLLSELPRFQEVYNGQLERYRQAHGIRNHAHPVPALDQQGGWIEAPWWIYRSNAPKRQKMWVRVLDEQLILCDRAGWQTVIEGRLDCDNASSQWLDLLADGVFLRPRALLTTMYLRLLVSDLFIHGIGGAKYDQLTDTIIQEFFGVTPPLVGVASATVHLPLSESTNLRAQRTADLISQQKQNLWRLKHQAERSIDPENDEAMQLTKKKQELLENIPPKGEKWDWHHEMTQINRRLAELVSPQTDAARQNIAELAASEKQRRIEQSREFSFCLYPQDFVADQLKNLAAI